MLATIIGIVGPLVLFLLKKWMESMKLTEEQKKNYYAFLEDIDKHTKIDVANYMAAGNSRQATIDRIKKARREREGL